MASLETGELRREDRADSRHVRQRLLRKVAVLGAGVMGSRIAAHLANAGLPVVLLDIVPPDTLAGDTTARNQIATAALNALRKAKPAALFDPSLAKFITVGNFEDHLEFLRDCDWVIEAVAENLEIKQSLLQKIAPHCHPDAMVTTNTSGLPIASIAAHMPPEFRSRWFGTHFFNPPRYMRLLEIIPTPEADPALIDRIAEFADKRLGKTVVRAKDTPNFIANRIGTFAMLNTVRLMQQQDLSIEDVDALTGAIIGWPKTGTFRLADMVGIDVLGHVAKNFAAQAEKIGDERVDVQLPAVIQTLLERKWLGDKTKQGFYRKQKDVEGNEIRQALDWKTLEYRLAARPKFPALEMAKNAEQLGERIRMLLAGDPRKDKAAAFYSPMLTELWTYAAHRIPEISDDIVGIDRAMKTGFNWELGPFEMWDAAGVRETVEKMRAEGKPIAPNVERLLAAGHTHWYRQDASAPSGRLFFDILSGEYRPIVQPEGVASVDIMKRAHGVVKKNPGASLIDLGDGIAVIEFHTKMNAIGGDIVRFITQTLRPDSDTVANFEAFVISGDATNFSVGANIMQLLLAMQEEEWDDIDLEIRSFQGMTAAVKFCPRPVVVAPYGMCLGGGTEISLHAARRQAHAELYMGLVETGVGLVPGGGGCKEMTLRAVNTAQSIRPDGRGESVEVMEAMKKAFETIAMAKVSTSVTEAHTLGFLSESDEMTMHRDRLLLDAKSLARSIADTGYAPPVPRTDIAAPGENVLATLLLGVYLMRQGEFISDHDVKVANHVAHILCGGKITAGTLVSEQYLLDLEREAFLTLCGEKKTQERIAFTLKTGKPLRN
ncbi:MAG TPA: 3-hydroxyacyl-CoA dehydrogenase NAD-binding domain-containing protein [Acidobacteriaceae bacterium]|jgi:3-hydroxyacyl-CoA dehydrogenase|nr:3-hydroxyacyl-CoA dehydrogenase NAD-binding domain-containing protein [Acidobacteriaceae bacterium]